MKQLTDAEIAAFECGMATTREMLNGGPCGMLAKALRAAYAEIERLNQLHSTPQKVLVAELTALREQLRWRTPDPKTGEWEELPIHLSFVLVTLDETYALECDCEQVQYAEYSMQADWFLPALDCSVNQKHIVAWRPCPAPYTPEGS